MQVPQTERQSDARLGERPAGRRQYAGTAPETTRSERNVPSHGDVVLTNVFGDPIVGRVGALTDDNVAQKRIPTRAQPAVADNSNGDAMARGDTFDLGLHRAGIAIDIDFKHGSGSSQSALHPVE